MATQKPSLIKGLDVKDKKHRVASYHKETVEAFVELLGAAGLHTPEEVNRSHIYRNENQTEIRRYDQSYPYIACGALLQQPYPAGWEIHMEESVAYSFTPNYKGMIAHAPS